jgi:hypothetical protein
VKQFIICLAVILIFPRFVWAIHVVIPQITLPVDSSDLTSSPSDGDIITNDGLTGQWEVVETDASASGPDPQYFYEFQLPTSGDYDLLFTDEYTGLDSITLSNTQYLISPTLIPLDDLNAPPYDPPSSPPFSPLPGADGTYPGNSSDTQTVLQAIISTPLPSTLWMGLAGIGMCGMMSLKKVTDRILA